MSLARWIYRTGMHRRSARFDDRQKFKFRKKLNKFDPEARETIIGVRNFTMISPDRLFSLIEAVRYVHRYAIPGAIVECGVWRGGAVMAAALTLRQLGCSDRTLFLYDTFTGMTEPGERDITVDGKTDAREIFRRTQTGSDSSDWCLAGLDEVKRNLATTGYDPGLFITVSGKVEDTLPATLPEEIAILRLDTDWYESTRHEMIHLFPRLVPGGVLIIDDYNAWSGSRKAVDEYLDSANVPIFLTKVDNAIVGVKPL